MSMSLGFADVQSILVQVMAWCVTHQAITWANVDLDFSRHMVSLGHNVLMYGTSSCHKLGITIANIWVNLTKLFATCEQFT